MDVVGGKKGAGNLMLSSLADCEIWGGVVSMSWRKIFSLILCVRIYRA